MDLCYEIGEITIERNYVSVNNSMSLYTKIKNISVNPNIKDDNEDFYFYENNNGELDFVHFIDKDGYIYTANDLEFKTYKIIWNETKSMIKLVDPVISIHVSNDHETEYYSAEKIRENRKESNIKLRKHKIESILKDD